jgi:hypothetical protein
MSINAIIAIAVTTVDTDCTSDYVGISGRKYGK